MKISGILKKYHKIEIELLLAHVLKKPKEFVYLNPERILSAYHFNILTSLIKRRLKGEPIAHIIGYKDFYGLRFKVDRRVLIPRPETEMLVDLAKSLKLKVESRGPIKILDIGTGSGNIIISLAKELQKWGKYTFVQNSHFFEYYASDISKKALTVAGQNAKLHKVKVKFIHSDILQNVGISADVIMANLPYGWSAWKNRSSAETAGLKFEPQSALFTKEGGLHLYRILLRQISARPPRPRLIYLEFDPRQKSNLHCLIKKYLPGAGVKFYRDYNKFWRCAEITR